MTTESEKVTRESTESNESNAQIGTSQGAKADTKADIGSFTPDELKRFLSELSAARGIKIPAFRAGQIFSWLTNGVTSFDEMTDLPKNLRVLLADTCYIATPTVARKLVSALDGTVKYLFRLYDGECVESVFMRYHHGNTLCISSQVGCRMGCRFCASTMAGLKRNLTPSEILGQVLAARRDTGERVSNIVMMGIGEPLDNYDNVRKFLTLVNLKEGLNIGYRHISLSTCGVVPGILRLSEEELPITLSVSLHNPEQKGREEIMPIAKKYDIETLISACRRYIGNGGRRISFEYTMIEGQNDTEEKARTLAKLLAGMLCHVNLIPLNSVDGRDYRKSGKETIARFAAILEQNGITATVRRKLGGDIDASCGQLRRAYIEEAENADGASRNTIQ